MTDKPARKRRWPRFNLKMMLIVFVLMGGLFGGFAKVMHRAERHRKAVAAVWRAEGDVYYDYQIQGRGFGRGQMSPKPAWLRRVFGEDFFADVVYVSLCRNDGTDDAMLKLIADEFPELTTLNVHGTLITDDGFEHLSRLTALEVLSVSKSQVTDSGLMQLKGLERLQILDLSGQKITDEGLEHLQYLSGLEVLWVYNTCVTADGIEELQQALPNCDVMTEGPWVSCEGDWTLPSAPNTP